MSAADVPFSGSTLLPSLLGLCRFPPSRTHVDLAVSGGADSLALLLLARHAGLDAVAHHVDHGLRATSSRDADVVRAVASRLGVPVLVHRVVVAAGPNLEARARDARFAALPDGVLTGHTADDRAETVFINLLRGAGSRGLSAMGPSPTRPLLALRRTDTRALCTELGIEPVRDETNENPRFVRNRVRTEMLPLAADISHRDPVPLILRTADVLGDDEALLDELSSGIDPTDALALASAPAPLARRALRRWLSDPHPPDAATIERILEVARNERSACDIGQNREIRRSKQRLTLRRLG